MHINLSSSSWRYAGTVSSDGGESEEGTVLTSTSSVLGYTDSEQYNKLASVSAFSQFCDTLKGTMTIIPGLKQTNVSNVACTTMVPQGVCIAGNYILISAYDYEKKFNSVIYVVDKDTGSYKTTLNLGFEAHVGGLAYDGRGSVFIADSSEKVVRILSLDEVSSAVDSGRDSYTVNISDSFSVSVSPSFLTYYGGRLYVGNFDTGNMACYTCTGSKWVQNYKKKSFLPENTQGISFVDIGGKTYLIASCSHGRQNKGKFYIYRCANTESKSIEKVAVKTQMYVPNMNEDLFLDGNILYTCYESAAKEYRSGIIWRSYNQVDRITENSIYKLINSAGSNTKNSYFLDSVESLEESDEVVMSGTCGDDLDYVLYEDGCLLISGTGDMEDYADDAFPWSDAKDDIVEIDIGADVSSISDGAFKNCTQLSRLTLSGCSDTATAFTIGSQAFYGCSELTTVSLPDKDYDISTDAFSSNDNLVISSDAPDVESYCSTNGISLHQHEYEYTDTQIAGCCSGGYDRYTCSCGAIELRNITEATGLHDYEVISETSSDDGTIKITGYECTECGSYYEEETEIASTSASTNVTNQNSSSNTTAQQKTVISTVKKTIKLKAIKLKNKRRKITGKVTKGTKLVVTIYNKKGKKLKKRTIKARKTKKGRFTLKLGFKIKKGYWVRIKATKKGYKTKIKKKTFK